MSDNDQNDSSGNDQTDGDSGSSSSSDSGQASSGTSSSVTASSGSGVNAQILDAVQQSTAAVMGSAANQGMATAYQKVAQAAAFAVQDATDYSRNIENIAMTAQGVIIAKMLESEANIPIYTPVLATVQEMVVAASTNLATVGATAATVASSFPSKA